MSAGRAPPTAPARAARIDARRGRTGRSPLRRTAGSGISGSTATNRFGRLARISAKRFSMVLKPLAMHHSSAAKSCLLPSLVLPAFQRRRQQIEFGQDIAEPGGEHFLALERAAQRQQRHVGAQRKCRRVARELAIEPRRVAGIGRRRKQATAPASAPGAEHGFKTVADMIPERLCRRRRGLWHGRLRPAHSFPRAGMDERGSRLGQTR